MSQSTEKISPELSKEKPHFSFASEDHSGVSELAPETRVPAAKVIAHDYNIAQKLITITEDKAFICLQRNLKALGKRRWLHPLSLLITMLLALATSDFDRLMWMSSDLLKATFIVTSLMTAGWLVWEIMHDGKLKEVPEAIGDIFAELRN